MARKEITTKADYAATMARIDKLMAKGSGNLTNAELQEIRRLALAAEKYEHSIYEIEIGEKSGFVQKFDRNKFVKNLHDKYLAKGE